MVDKRSFPRKKKRLLVEFGVNGGRQTGFTWDLSFTGVFIACHSLPKLGEVLTVTLHMGDGKKVELHGRAVRARKVPAQLAYTEPSGFSLAITSYSEEYTRYMTTL